MFSYAGFSTHAWIAFHFRLVLKLLKLPIHFTRFAIALIRYISLNRFTFSDERHNAEFMSLTNKLPLLKVDNHFVAGFDAICAYARLRVRLLSLFANNY